jgi:hypothetical protein
VKITNSYISPEKGPLNTMFTISMNYTVLSPTSTGYIALYIQPPENDGLEMSRDEIGFSN